MHRHGLRLHAADRRYGRRYGDRLFFEALAITRMNLPVADDGTHGTSRNHPTHSMGSLSPYQEGGGRIIDDWAQRTVSANPTTDTGTGSWLGSSVTRISLHGSL